MRLADCYSDILSYVLYLLASPDGGAGAGYDKVRSDLESLLRTADDRAAKAGFPRDETDEARFAVCAFADEAILCSSWPGARQWRVNQLQKTYFDTQNAGVEFFERLERLPKQAGGAREVYALCLELGFRGEYFVGQREDELTAVRLRAVREALGRPQPDFSEESRLLFPEAYQAGATKGRGFNPWSFDWWVFAAPVLAVAIVAEFYLLLRDDLNIQLLRFFGSLS